MDSRALDGGLGQHRRLQPGAGQPVEGEHRVAAPVSDHRDPGADRGSWIAQRSTSIISGTDQTRIAPHWSSTVSQTRSSAANDRVCVWATAAASRDAPALITTTGLPASRQACRPATNVGPGVGLQPLDVERHRLGAGVSGERGEQVPEADVDLVADADAVREADPRPGRLEEELGGEVAGLADHRHPTVRRVLERGQIDATLAPRRLRSSWGRPAGCPTPGPASTMRRSSSAPSARALAEARTRQRRRTGCPARSTAQPRRARARAVRRGMRTTPGRRPAPGWPRPSRPGCRRGRRWG